MWDHREYIGSVKPVTLDQLLRENSWVIRKNESWENLPNLESLKGQSVVLGKVYTSTDKKGKNNKKTINDIAIGEIQEVRWSKDTGVTLSVRMFAKTQPKPTELDITIVLNAPALNDDWMRRVRVPDLTQFNAVYQTKSLTCLVFEIGRKTDLLFGAFLKGTARQNPSSPKPTDPLGEELRNTNLPK
jgi:hypothetical protein